MTKTTTLNHSLGFSGAGAGFGGWLGVKLRSGIWCVPCIEGESPTTVGFDVFSIPKLVCVHITFLKPELSNFWLNTPIS
jgi:hypothetical protein